MIHNDTLRVTSIGSKEIKFYFNFFDRVESEESIHMSYSNKKEIIKKSLNIQLIKFDKKSRHKVINMASSMIEIINK